MLKPLLEKIKQITTEVIGENLVGIYLHGSYAFGCFNWDKSDLDYLVVVERPLTLSQKVRYITELLRLRGECPPKGLEMSVVTAEHCENFIHPTPYDLHFSNAHLERAERETAAYCKAMQGVDPDLAAHFTVTRAVGRVLCGKPIEEVFAPVPLADYLDSIKYDVENAETDILTNPVYVTLNLCRALAFVRENAILSKADGGKWGLENLPTRYHPIIQAALTAYTTARDYPSDAQSTPLTAFAADMLKQIFG